MAQAAKTGRVVTLRPETQRSLGGYNVYLHEREVHLSELSEFNREALSYGWLMALTNRCVCDS